MKKFSVLVDLDEVLADFRSGACEVHGWDKDEIDAKTMELNCWDMCQPTGITQDEFWKPIHQAGCGFWSRLKPLPWFDQLVGWLNERFKEDWYVVSSPSRCPTSYYGKALWIEEKFGHAFMNYRFIPFCNKSILAKVGTLIDDRPENVAKFIDAGGDAILFPSVGNTLHPYRNNPVGYLKTREFYK